MQLKQIRLLVCSMSSAVALGCGLAASRRVHRAVFAGSAPDSAVNRHSCGHWLWQPPDNARRLLDIDPTPDDTVTDGFGLAERIRAAGGRIVHVFAVPRVRAEVDLNRALALTGEVTLVHDSTKFDVPVVVTLDSALSARDSGRLAQAGARWISPHESPTPGRGLHLMASMPDSLIPIVRTEMGAHVRSLGAVCVVQ